jgi:hypothetical protein
VDLKGLTFGALTRTGTTSLRKLGAGLDVVCFEGFALGVWARFVAPGEDCLIVTFLLNSDEILLFDIETTNFADF